MRIWKNRHVQRISFALFAVALFLSANYVQHWRNDQLELFNDGLTAYNAGDLVTALQQFDDSIAAYNRREANESIAGRSIFGQPDRLIAARAAFQRGKILVALAQNDAALAAYKQSLILNPGNGLSDVSLATAKNWQQEARFTQYDLELLFAGNEVLAKQEGLGREASSDNQPPPGSGPAQPEHDDPTQF